MKDRFVPIPGFPNYFISDEGKIWSVPRQRAQGHFLKVAKNSGGYLRVTLCKDGQKFDRTIHKLVLKTFVGPCPSGLECRHLNGVPNDNRLSNLRWGTRSENAFDKIKHGTSNTIKRPGQKYPSATLTTEDVVSIKQVLLNTSMKQQDIAEKYNVSPSTISNIKCGKTWADKNLETVNDSEDLF